MRFSLHGCLTVMGKCGLLFTTGWSEKTFYFYLPFNPNVPDIEGCSPVNFLGVFCFRPGSGEKHRALNGQLIQGTLWEYVVRYTRYSVILLCRILSGSSSGKGGGRLPPSLSLPPASDDVLWDCDCWDWGWTGCDWWVCWLWLCCFLSLFWWASSPFWEGMDTSRVFFTLKNTGEGGLFSMGLDSQSVGGQFWAVSIMMLLRHYLAHCGWEAVKPSHLFLVLNLTGVFWSLACLSLGSILTLSGWFHSLCFCRRTFVANTASQ